MTWGLKKDEMMEAIENRAKSLGISLQQITMGDCNDAVRDATLRKIRDRLERYKNPVLFRVVESIESGWYHFVIGKGDWDDFCNEVDKKEET